MLAAWNAISVIFPQIRAPDVIVRCVSISRSLKCALLAQRVPLCLAVCSTSHT
jgi:hypothetical protein